MHATDHGRAPSLVGTARPLELELEFTNTHSNKDSLIGVHELTDTKTSEMIP